MITISLFMIAATVFTISGIFQIVRMCRTGSARDVSFWYVTLLTLSVAATWGIVMIDQNGFYIRVERTLGVVSSLVVWGAMLHFKLKDRCACRRETAKFVAVADQLRDVQRQLTHQLTLNRVLSQRVANQRRTLEACHERATDRNKEIARLQRLLRAYRRHSGWRDVD